MPGHEAPSYAILDQAVDVYAPDMAGLENGIDEIEDNSSTGAPRVSTHLRPLRRGDRVQRTTKPRMGMLAALRPALTSVTSSGCGGSCEMSRTT